MGKIAQFFELEQFLILIVSPLLGLQEMMKKGVFKINLKLMMKKGVFKINLKLIMKKGCLKKK